MDLKALSGRIVSVTWKRTDQVILKFMNGKVLPDSSQRNYDGRLKFAHPDKFILKNFSLRLKNISIEDEGEYICDVRTREKSENYFVSLQVCKYPGIRIRTARVHTIVSCCTHTHIHTLLLQQGNW